MDVAALVLEYLKVLLSAPVMAAATTIAIVVIFKADLKALLLRIAKIRFPGGAELSTSQSERQESEAAMSQKPTPTPSPGQPTVDLPGHLTPAQQDEVSKLLLAEQATSRIWEYRFLNYYLVNHTQRVLDWLAALPQPVSYSFYDSHWLPAIPSADERGAIINALQAHHLIQVTRPDNQQGNSPHQFITVTDKGREYLSWRGPVPATP